MFPTARRQLPVSCSTSTQSTPYLSVSNSPAPTARILQHINTVHNLPICFKQPGANCPYPAAHQHSPQPTYLFPTARRQLPVSCSTSTQSTPYLYISSRPIFIPPCHPHLRLPSCLFPSAVPNKTQFISVLSTGSPAHLILLRLIIPI